MLTIQKIKNFLKQNSFSSKFFYLIRPYYRSIINNKSKNKIFLKTSISTESGVFLVEDIRSDISILKIAVVVHVFYLEKVPKVVKYLSNIPYSYSLYFTVTEEKKDELIEILSMNSIVEYELVVYENRGYDILPFLSVLPKLQKLNYDIVCKIHTKKGAANLEEYVSGIDNVWFNTLMDSVLGSAQTIKKIVNAFEKNKDLGLLGSADFYKSAHSLMYGNEVLTSQLLNVIDETFDIGEEWGFVAGSIFWARLEIFEPLINNKNFDVLYEKSFEMKSGEKASVFHATERLFGALPKIAKMQSAVSYAIDIKRESHGIEILSVNSLVSPISIGMTLQNEHEIIKNYNFLQDKKEFDSKYYTLHTPSTLELNMNPLLHFLRYGIYQNQAPNENFSPFSYWNIHNDVLLNRCNPLIHFIKKKKISMPSENSYELAIKLIKNSELFNNSFYRKEYSDISQSGMNPLHHYCKFGYKEGRIPSLEFDVLWYEKRYLSDYLGKVNPLLHYILVGKNQNLKIKPFKEEQSLIKCSGYSNSPKRICLFAGYDAEGIIDESVIVFIKELSNYSDVYFLSDSLLENGELDKLAPYIKAGWGIRHGEYDFGSYKRLAKYLVGWKTIEEYDEVMLVNDSSYLIRPLKDIFSKMDSKSCSWWGMQSTKGMYATKDKLSNQFTQKIPLSIVKNKLLHAYAQEDEYDFHIGSYFLVFKKPLIKSGELKKILNGVKREINKKSIILKYEIGMTRELINKGYEFDTFMDDLYPFHPIYTNNIYDMIREGFPLYKRFFLSENHYKVSDLKKWKEKLLKLVPELDIKPIEDNLYRITDATKLYNNFHLDGQQLLTDKEFIKADKKSKIDNGYWIFPVCAYNHLFSGNERAVFEEVKNNPNITKVILFRSKHIALDGVNVKIVPLQSYEGQQYLLKSKVIFIKHTPRENALYPLDAKKHKFINLWHGIPLKRIGVASLDLESKFKTISTEHAKCHSVISSSSIDRMAMTVAFYPLKYQDIWVTGLPRNDFILKEESLLPQDFQDELKKLKLLLGGKKFILYAPTFRNKQEEGYYHFSHSEQERLNKYLIQNNIILGVREHMADSAHSYSRELKGESIINVGGKYFSNIEMLYRKADLLITDYSSCFIDFMLTGKPMISFAFDYEEYIKEERGLFYSLEFAFAGKICQDFNSLLSEIEFIMDIKGYITNESYIHKQKIFFDYLDEYNSKRLVDRVIKEK